MTEAPGVAAVRLAIEHAVVLPRMMESAPEPVAPEEPKNLPRHLRHLSAAFAARLPIGFCGIAEAALADPRTGIAEKLYLYRDANGLPRSFGALAHERDGIASLFAGDDRLLSWLWPGRRAGWDHEKAAETLFCRQGWAGIVRGAAFELAAEPPELGRAHLGVSRLARRLLRRGLDPYQVLDLAHGWNATRGHGALSGEAVVQIVDAGCARELRIEERRRAG